MDGNGDGVLVPVDTRTNSDRQTPSPGITVEDPLQVAVTHVPERKNWLELDRTC